MRWIAAAAATMMVTLAATATGQTVQTEPTCANDAALKTTQPAYVQQGQSFTVAVAPGPNVDAARLTDIVLLMENGPTSALTPTGDGSQLTLQAPSSGHKFDLIYRWYQDLGTPMACFGQVEYTVALYPSGMRLGDPSLARLSGRMHVTLTPAGGHRRPTRLIWTLSSGCDFFACETAVHSSGGAGATAHVEGSAYVITTTARFLGAAAPCSGPTTIRFTVAAATSQGVARTVTGHASTRCAHRTVTVGVRGVRVV